MVALIGHRMALFYPQISHVHVVDGRVLRGFPAGANLVVLLFIKRLGERVTDLVSRVPRAASRPLLETHQHGVVPAPSGGLNVSNRLATGIGGAPRRRPLSGSGSQWRAKNSAIWDGDEGGGYFLWEAAPAPA